jgi:hypothetical protein
MNEQCTPFLPHKLLPYWTLALAATVPDLNVPWNDLPIFIIVEDCLYFPNIEIFLLGV